MNTRDTSAWNNWSSRKRHYLAYSRHLCITTRATDVMESTPSTSSSDLEDKMFHGPYDRFKRRNLTLNRQLSALGSIPQQVYNMDQRFHKKFGTKHEMIYKHAFAPTPHQTSKAGPTNSVYCCIDDDASSFCDSVSSMACSSITHVDKQEKFNKDVHKFSDKYAKFDAIEKWLESVPKPVLKSGLGNLSKM